MTYDPHNSSPDVGNPLSRCPFHNGTFTQHPAQKTAQPNEQPVSKAALERDAAGVWHVRGFAESRALLRLEGTTQAGFGAERISMMPEAIRPPVLHQEGEAHHEQRTKTARFFTPVTTDKKYRGFMEDYAKSLVAELKAQGRADLNAISMQLAVQVAAQVIGLTNSRLPGMTARINKFFHPMRDLSGARKLINELYTNLQTGKFFFLDVHPAMRARRGKPQEDLISHLVAEGHSAIEILTECVTYSAAGMITTREFICAAAWHFLDSPNLKASYLQADEKERYQILHELLRLEPVVGTLMRRAAKDLDLVTGGKTVTIPAGDLIKVSIYGANSDEDAVGDDPLSLCPARETAPKVPAYAMSFGDGHHRCPGAYIAIQETDIFLQELLKIETLVLESGPALDWDELTTGYELPEMWVSV